MPLIAVLVSWIAVTTDCRGALDQGPITYLIEVFESRCTGRLVPCGPDGEMCPECHATSERATAQTSVTIEDPAVNEVIGWDNYPTAPPPVMALDEAGNRSDEACP